MTERDRALNKREAVSAKGEHRRDRREREREEEFCERDRRKK